MEVLNRADDAVKCRSLMGPPMQDISKIASKLCLAQASDDADCMQYYEGLETLLHRFNQYASSLKDGSTFQVKMDETLSEIALLLKSIRCLTVDAESNTYSDEEKSAIEDEIHMIESEIRMLHNRLMNNI